MSPRGLISFAGLLFIGVLLQTGYSWMPNKKLLQQEESCRSHRHKRDLHGLLAKTHHEEGSNREKRLDAHPKKPRLILARADQPIPVTENPPIFHTGFSAATVPRPITQVPIVGRTTSYPHQVTHHPSHGHRTTDRGIIGQVTQFPTPPHGKVTKEPGGHRYTTPLEPVVWSSTTQRSTKHGANSHPPLFSTPNGNGVFSVTEPSRLATNRQTTLIPATRKPLTTHSVSMTTISSLNSNPSKFRSEPPSNSGPTFTTLKSFRSTKFSTKPTPAYRSTFTTFPSSTDRFDSSSPTQSKGSTDGASISTTLKSLSSLQSRSVPTTRAPVTKITPRSYSLPWLTRTTDVLPPRMETFVSASPTTFSPLIHSTTKQKVMTSGSRITTETITKRPPTTLNTGNPSKNPNQNSSTFNLFSTGRASGFSGSTTSRNVATETKLSKHAGTLISMQPITATRPASTKATAATMHATKKLKFTSTTKVPSSGPLPFSKDKFSLQSTSNNDVTGNKVRKTPKQSGSTPSTYSVPWIVSTSEKHPPSTKPFASATPANFRTSQRLRTTGHVQSTTKLKAAVSTLDLYLSSTSPSVSRISGVTGNLSSPKVDASFKNTISAFSSTYQHASSYTAKHSRSSSNSRAISSSINNGHSSPEFGKMSEKPFNTTLSQNLYTSKFAEITQHPSQAASKITMSNSSLRLHVSTSKPHQMSTRLPVHVTGRNPSSTFKMKVTTVSPHSISQKYTSTMNSSVTSYMPLHQSSTKSLFTSKREVSSQIVLTQIPTKKSTKSTFRPSTSATESHMSTSKPNHMSTPFPVHVTERNPISTFRTKVTTFSPHSISQKDNSVMNSKNSSITSYMPLRESSTKSLFTSNHEVPSTFATTSKSTTVRSSTSAIRSHMSTSKPHHMSTTLPVHVTGQNPSSTSSTFRMKVTSLYTHSITQKDNSAMNSKNSSITSYMPLHQSSTKSLFTSKREVPSVTQIPASNSTKSTFRSSTSAIQSEMSTSKLHETSLPVLNTAEKISSTPKIGAKFSSSATKDVSITKLQHQSTKISEKLLHSQLRSAKVLATSKSQFPSTYASTFIISSTPFSTPNMSASVPKSSLVSKMETKFFSSFTRDASTTNPPTKISEKHSDSQLVASAKVLATSKPRFPSTYVSTSILSSTPFSTPTTSASVSKSSSVSKMQVLTYPGLTSEQLASTFEPHRHITTFAYKPVISTTLQETRFPSSHASTSTSSTPLSTSTISASASKSSSVSKIQTLTSSRFTSEKFASTFESHRHISSFPSSSQQFRHTSTTAKPFQTPSTVTPRTDPIKTPPIVSEQTGQKLATPGNVFSSPGTTNTNRPASSAGRYPTSQTHGLPTPAIEIFSPTASSSLRRVRSASLAETIESTKEIMHRKMPDSKVLVIVMCNGTTNITTPVPTSEETTTEGVYPFGSSSTSSAEETTTSTTTPTTTTTTRKSTTTRSTTTSTTEPPTTTRPNRTRPCSSQPDVCSCRKTQGCGFTGQCEKVETICTRHRFSESECIRTPNEDQAEVYYIYAGIPCPYGKRTRKRDGSNSRRSQNCKVEQTILAVNLGTNQGHVDGYGIQFMPERQVPFKDPHKTRKTDISLQLKGVDKREQWLYRWQIWGDWNKAKPGNCIKYDVELSRDGEYELNLKMIDNYWRRKGSRGFNVLFNNVTILPELDLISVIKQQFKAVDFILNFKVKKHGKELVMPGLAPSEIQNGFAELAFCFGECNTTDEDYHVAGFSVVRFVAQKEAVSSQACHRYRMLPCLCKHAGCQYNVEYGDCRHLAECSDAMFHGDDCRRANVFYSDGGVLCHNRHDAGNCHLSRTALAINLNGRTYTNSWEIRYAADNLVPYEDEWETRTKGQSRECLGISQEDRELYCNYIEGISSKADNDRCLVYNIPIAKDGNYELNIKMGEFNHDSHDERSFNIQVNGEVVIKELDLLAVTRKNTPIDLNILFTVLGNVRTLWMKGYGLQNIEGKHMKLGFCYGSWSKNDPSWTVSAFHVVRFSHGFKNPADYTVLS